MGASLELVDLVSGPGIEGARVGAVGRRCEPVAVDPLRNAHENSPGVDARYDYELPRSTGVQQVLMKSGVRILLYRCRYLTYGRLFSPVGC